MLLDKKYMVATYRLQLFKISQKAKKRQDSGRWPEQGYKIHKTYSVSIQLLDLKVISA